MDRSRSRSKSEFTSRIRHYLIELSVPILVKCNPIDITGDQFSVTLDLESGTELIENDCAYVWISEKSPEKPKMQCQRGLAARGRLAAYELLNGTTKATVRICISQRFAGKQFGMTELGDEGKSNHVAASLHEYIKKNRRRRIWPLLSERRAYLHQVFQTAIAQSSETDLDGEIARALRLAENRVALAGTERTGQNPPRFMPNSTDTHALLKQRWREQNGICALCQRVIPLRAENKLLRMSLDRMDSMNKNYDCQNTRFTHLACNLGKSDATIEEWDAYLDMIRQTSA